jgi:hypothetical protein
MSRAYAEPALEYFRALSVVYAKIACVSPCVCFVVCLVANKRACIVLRNQLKFTLVAELYHNPGYATAAIISSCLFRVS